MKYAPADHPLFRCVDEFETALERLAWQLAAQVVRDEYARRRRGGRKGRKAAPQPEPAPVVATPVAPVPEGRKRWTRERVIAELCEWLISGIVEPTFLRRHGAPGLVTAATRIFGRFDSALNVANLYLAKQYPDGPPARRNALAAARQRTPRTEPRAAADAADASERPAPLPEIAGDDAAPTDGPRAE